jgi:hypothetical protein
MSDLHGNVLLCSSQGIEEAELTSSPPPYCLSQEAEGDSVQGSCPVTPLYQADKLSLDPDFPSRKVSSNTAESRSLRSNQSDLVSLPVFSDQVASRLHSQLSTGSRGSGRTDPSLPDLEAPPLPPPPCLRSFSGRGTCPPDSSNLRKRSEDPEHHYYYAPVYPTPSSPAGKMADVGNHYYCTPNDLVARASHAQKASDQFQYLPESPVPPPSPSLKPVTFRGNNSSLPGGCHGQNSSPVVGGGGPDRLCVHKERSSTSRDHFNHEAWHRHKEHFTGNMDRQLGEEADGASDASSRASSQLPSSSSPLPHRPLVFSLGSQQVRMKKMVSSAWRAFLLVIFV